MTESEFDRFNADHRREFEEALEAVAKGQAIQFVHHVTKEWTNLIGSQNLAMRVQPSNTRFRAKKVEMRWWNSPDCIPAGEIWLASVRSRERNDRHLLTGVCAEGITYGSCLRVWAELESNAVYYSIGRTGSMKPCKMDMEASRT